MTNQIEKKKITKPEDCPSYESCSAPICPLNSPEKYIWYPDEEVCRSTLQSNVDWIRTQKKIAKRAKDNTKYFTFQMLNLNRTIMTGVAGLDPDKEEAPQLKRWLDRHPVRKEMPLAQRKAAAERLHEYHQLKKK